MARLMPPSRADAESPKIDLDVNALLGAKLLPPKNMAHLLAEELRVIKRPLLLNAESVSVPLANANLVMVGSALPGSGKTFMSFNIAMSMSTELDWNVLLVDADVSRPSLSRHLGLADAPGLIGLLESEDGKLAEYVFQTNYPRLSVLPAGPPGTHGKELLGSQRMRSMIQDLASHERHIVIFDSPPLLMTSEARVLASLVGQIVLVVEAAVTPRRSVLEAIEMLDPSKAINLVLNKNRHLLGGDYHYSGYEPYSRDAVDGR
jgi:receptor protein-tyrosine kinase